VAKEIEDWERGLALDPTDARAFCFLGFAYGKTERFEKAIECYNKALHVEPKQSHALNQLAWLLATCPVESVRNGREAVKLATTACEQTNWQSSQLIDTLAAAFAEIGDFENALKHQRRAVSMGDLDENILKQMNEHLSSYEKQRPLREKPR
jgi:tetratricopeptide (TPR) repeat protein